MDSSNNPLIAKYEVYQQEYNAKCAEWRSEPVVERRLNDRGCIVGFFIFTAIFFGVGAYYLVLYKNIPDPVVPHPDDDSTLYISKNLGAILGCAAIALITSFFYVLMFKLMPKVMVYTLIGLSLGMLLVLAIVGLFIDFIALTICMIGTFLVYSLVLYCFRKKIQVGIVVIKVAGEFITDRPLVYVVPLIKIVLSFSFAIFWVYSFCAMIAVANDRAQKQESQGPMGAFVYLWIFFWLFYNFLFYYIMVFTIAVGCAFWYYRVEKNFMWNAYKWIATNCFGSLVFASALIAIVTFVRMIVDGNRRGKKNLVQIICLCIVSYILRVLEELIKIINHTSVIVMSVTGESFINAAKTTIGILSSNLPLYAVVNVITNLLVFWGVVLVTGIATVLGYLMLPHGENDDANELGSCLGLIIVLSISISILVLSVLVESVACVYVFYCFDNRFKDLGYATHHMPTAINDELHGVESRAEKVDSADQIPSQERQ